MRLSSLFSREEAPKEPEAAKPPEAAPPQYVTAEALEASQSRLMEKLAGLAERLVPQTGAPSAPTRAPVSEQDVEAALASGEGAARKIAELVNDRVSSAVSDLREREVTPLRTTGLNSLEQMAKQSVLGNIPKEHVRFMPEVEAIMKNVPVEMRANPDTWRTAYATTIGLHSNELINEAREAALRTAAEPRPESAPQPPQLDMGEGKRLRIPSIEEYAGEEGIAALAERGKGQNPDEWARAAGYDDWGDYIRMAAKFEEPIDEYPNIPLGSRTFNKVRGPHAGN